LSTVETPVVGTKTWFLGTGRRKESWLACSCGRHRQIHGERPRSRQVFSESCWSHDATEPLKFTSLTSRWTSSSRPRRRRRRASRRVRMGLSRAIIRFNPELRPALRKNGFLTRDSRMKERKKYGQKGARKRFQFTKR